ncbi:MAG TPA: sigma-70 family RNA polymerase sigma factor [Bacteroidales bacterium]
MEDSEAIKLIKQGEREQFRVLVERHQAMVFRTCMGFLHNQHDAEDLTQEVFIKAYQSIDSFKGDSAFSTWIYRIAVNASLNKVRANSKNFLFQKLDTLLGSGKNYEPSVVFHESENPEDMLVKEEHRLWVQKALDSLPENQRTAIVLSKYDELSQKEIAEIMNTTEGAVESLIQRAKTNLREKLFAHLKKNKK